MNLQLKLALRLLQRRPWYGVLSIVGIALGIAVVLAIDIANESSRHAFRASNEAVKREEELEAATQREVVSLAELGQR